MPERSGPGRRAAAAPAQLAYRRAALPEGLSVNRRGLPYAPWLALLDIRAEAGARLGVLANLAVHPVALGPECFAVSADWVAPFRSAVESLLGGTTLMLSGALGDVNPRHVHRQNNNSAANGFDEAEALGRELAEVVAAEAPTAEIMTSSIAVVRSEDLTAPVGSTMLSQLRVAPTTAVELVEWSLGGARLISVPGEAFHEFGRAIERSRSVPVILAGLCPTWNGYLPVPFTEGYEEQMSLGKEFVGLRVLGTHRIGPMVTRRAKGRVVTATGTSLRPCAPAGVDSLGSRICGPRRAGMQGATPS